MTMMIFKKCLTCGIHFPSVLRTWKSRCPEHEADLERDMNRIKDRRFIPPDWFDVYDEHYEHLCRACGARLLNKKGEHSNTMRWCKRNDPEHQQWRKESDCGFNTERFQYTLNLAMRQFNVIYSKNVSFFQDDARYKIHEYDQGKIAAIGNNFLVMCEKCGGLAEAGVSYFGLRSAHVHHKKPIHQLQMNEIYLIFDHSNFICLCTACHGEAHRGPRRQAASIQKFTRLDTFLVPSTRP